MKYGMLIPVPKVSAGNELRRKHSGLLVDGRVRRREIRHVEDGKTPDEHLGALVIDRMGLLVLDDLGRPDLPERRPLGMVLTGFAGGVASLFKYGHVAVHALAARRGEARLVGGQRLDAVDEAVAEIFAELEPRPVNDVAVFVGHLGVTLGVDAFGHAIVDDPVGLQETALVEQLDRALRGHSVFVLVVDQFVGVNDELVGRLGGRHRRRMRSRRGRRDHCRRQAQNRPCNCGRAESRETGPGTPTQVPLKRGADGGAHQPSSWCSKTYTPNKHPTSSGDQPAATGLMKPASPRSLITLVAT